MIYSERTFQPNPYDNRIAHSGILPLPMLRDKCPFCFTSVRGNNACSHQLRFLSTLEYVISQGIVIEQPDPGCGARSRSDATRPEVLKHRTVQTATEGFTPGATRSVMPRYRRYSSYIRYESSFVGWRTAVAVNQKCSLDRESEKAAPNPR